MSSESDRPVEKRMRDYSAARKAAASPDEFALHPVTRNSLKVEIVKVYGRRFPGESERPFWEKWWPKIAMAGGGVFVLALLIVLAFPSKPSGDDATLTMAKKEIVPTPVPGNPEDSLSPPEKFSPMVALDSLSQPMAPVAKESPGDVVFDFFALKATSPVSRGVPPAAMPAAPVAESITTTTPERRKTVEISTSVSRSVDPPSAGLTQPDAAPLLLASFQFRINGDTVVIIDRDQSRYVGIIRPIDPNLLKASIPATVGAAALGDTTDPEFPTKYRLYSEQGTRRSGLPPAGQFSVAGTNRTTGQPVTFNGRMLTWTQAGPTTGSAAEAPPTTVLQIEGSVTLGAGAAISINATTKP